MKKIYGRWQITEEFPYNNDKYNLAHPAITVTGDTLQVITEADPRVTVDELSQAHDTWKLAPIVIHPFEFLTVI